MFLFFNFFSGGGGGGFLMPTATTSFVLAIFRGEQLFTLTPPPLPLSRLPHRLSSRDWLIVAEVSRQIGFHMPSVMASARYINAQCVTFLRLGNI